MDIEEQTPDIVDIEDCGVTDIDEPEAVEEVKNELEKPKKKARKPRKPMTDKQKEVLKNGREKAKLNQARRMLKEREERLKIEGVINEEEEPAIKSELCPIEEEEHPICQKPRKLPGKKMTKKKKPTVVYVEESSSDEDSSSEEEIVYVKRPKQSKKSHKKQSRKVEPRHYSNIEEVTDETPRLIFK